MSFLENDYKDRPEAYYWGDPTSTMNWCEPDYVNKNFPMFAEFYNTISNAGFIIISLIGIWNCYKINAEIQFYLGHLSIIVVGIGSFSFHATLLYIPQLLDEIPMIWTCLIFLYCTMQGNYTKVHIPFQGTSLALILTSLGSFISLTYIFGTTNPVFFLASYGILVVLLVVISIQIWIHYRHEDQHISVYFPLGLFSYALGFFVWNLDNHFCPSTEPYKLHAWWHILAGYGTYCMFTMLLYFKMRFKLRKRVGMRLIFLIVPIITLG